MYKLDTLSDIRNILNTPEYSEYLDHENKDSTVDNFIYFINKENGTEKTQHYFNQHEKHNIVNFGCRSPRDISVANFLALENITTLFFFQKILKNYPFTNHLIENTIYRSNFLTNTLLTDFCYITRLKVIHTPTSKPMYLLLQWVSDTKSVDTVGVKVEGETTGQPVNLDEYQYVFDYEGREATICLGTGTLELGYPKTTYEMDTIEKAKKIYKSKEFKAYYRSDAADGLNKELAFIDYYNRHVRLTTSLTPEVKHYLRYLTNQLPNLELRYNLKRLSSLIHAKLFNRYTIDRQSILVNPRYIPSRYGLPAQLASDNYSPIPLYNISSWLKRKSLTVELEDEGDTVTFYLGTRAVYQIRKFLFSPDNGEDLSLLERYILDSFVDKTGYSGYTTTLKVANTSYPYKGENYEITYTLHDGSIQFSSICIYNHREVKLDSLKGRYVYMSCEKNVQMSTPERLDSDGDIYVKSITLQNLVRMDWN